jgi:hypothetical protein
VKGKNGEMLSRGPLVGYTTSLALWDQTYTPLFMQESTVKGN